MTLTSSPHHAPAEFRAENVLAGLRQPLLEGWCGRMTVFPSRLKIHIQDGQISAVEGHTPLGQILVRENFLAEKDLSTHLTPAQRLGDALTQQDVLPTERLQEALRLQAEQALDYLLHHPPTSYQFRPRERLSGLHANLTLGNLAMHRAQTQDILPLSQIFRLAKVSQPVILDAEQWELLRWFNGRRTLGRAIEISSLSQKSGMAAATRLLNEGLLEPSAINGLRIIVARLRPATSLRQPPATIRANLFLKHLDGQSTIQEMIERLHYPAEEAALMLTSLYRDDVIDLIHGDHEMRRLLEEF